MLKESGSDSYRENNHRKGAKTQSKTSLRLGAFAVITQNFP